MKLAMPRNSTIRFSWIHAIQRVSDFLIVLVSGLLSYWLRHKNFSLSATYWLALLGLALLNGNILGYLGLYRIHLPCCILAQQLKSIALSWSLSMLGLILVLFFSRQSEDISRIWVSTWWVLGIGVLLISRVLLTKLLTHWNRSGILGERVVIVGAGDIGKWLLDQIRNKTDGHVQVVGIFDDRKSRLILQEGTIEIDGTTDDLLDFVRENNIDMIVMALPSQSEERLNQLVMKLRVLPVEIHICPGRIGFSLERSEVVEMGGIPLLKVVSRPLETWGVFVKRIEDIILSVIILILIAPLLVCIALAVKISSPGPVFFVQFRGGFNGYVFRMFKFRSMYVPTSVDSKVKQATLGDPRITRIGSFLRRSSLDELPQFFNVLKGDMSIVGPRPHAVEHDEEFRQIISSYVSRLRVKPGITGWAQIHGFRGLTDTREKLLSRPEYDLFYIDHWSLWLDLWIILKTVLTGMVNKNAY